MCSCLCEGSGCIFVTNRATLIRNGWSVNQQLLKLSLIDSAVLCLNIGKKRYG